MEFKLKSNLFLKGTKAETERELISLLTLPNPAYHQAEKLGKWTGNLDRTIKFFTRMPGGGLMIPRGFAEPAYRVCQGHGKDIQIIDNRLELEPVEFDFTGKLRPFQETGIQTMLTRSDGIMVFPTGGGKTVAMLSLITRRKQPTLVIVDKKELVYQWRDRAGQFLGMDPEEIGIIGGGVFKLGNRLTIYTSTCETARDRKFRRANELRRKIGAKAGSANRLPIFKPKGMHQKTWDRIRWEIEILEEQGWSALDRMMRNRQ